MQKQFDMYNVCVDLRVTNYAHLVVVLQSQVCFPHVQIGLFTPVITLIGRKRCWDDCTARLRNGTWQFLQQ